MSIKANELRLGNWLIDNNQGYVDKSLIGRHVLVETIGYSGINITSSWEGSWECEHDEKNLDGIPLSGELLEKCGFVFNTNKTYGEHYSITQKQGSKVVLNMDSWYKAAVKDNPFHVFHNGIEIKSLHGEELPVNI